MEVRRISSAYGDCLVKKRSAAARTFVLQYLRVKKDDRAAHRVVEQIADPGCALDASLSASGVRMSFPGDTMRYVLADALFRVELAAQPPISHLEQVSPLQHATLDEAEFQAPPGKKLKERELAKLAEDRAKEVGLIALSQLGECIVRESPAASYALLRTKVTSPEENAAFGPVAKSASQCLTQGMTVALNKSVLRGTVAFNYYRLAHAPKALSPAAGVHP
jgi:hypothetical protein